MSEITATEAARRFADLLDSVEHAGQRYTITRRGKAVAQIEPVSRGRGSDAQSTAWAIQAHLAAGRRPPAGALAFLRRLQRPDGSIRYDNVFVWASGERP